VVGVGGISGGGGFQVQSTESYSCFVGNRTWVGGWLKCFQMCEPVLDFHRSLERVLGRKKKPEKKLRVGGSLSQKSPFSNRHEKKAQVGGKGAFRQGKGRKERKQSA